MATRIEYLDFLKMFAIFCVLLGHSTEQLSADVFWDHPLWAFIYTYHMPLFMLLCGFFFHSSLKKTYKEMATKKFIQLGIPSITAFLIGCVIMLIIQTDAIADLCEISFNGFMNSVWFLKCVLFCYLIMYPVCKVIKNDYYAAILATIVITIIPGADIVNLNFMLPMFCLGMICGNHLESIERHRKWLTIASVTVFFLLLIFWSGRLTVYMVPTRTINQIDGRIDWQNLGVTVYRLAIGMAGSVMFFLFAKPVYAFISRFRIAPLLCRIGSATLGIYFLQTFLLEIFVHMLHIYLPVPVSLVVAPILAVTELTICYNLVLLIRKDRMASLLLLGESHLRPSK